MEGLINFMNTSIGRGVRALLGLVLIYLGLAVVGGSVGLIVAVVGLVPIAMAIWGHCLLEFAFPKAKHA